MALEIVFWVAAGLIVFAHLGYPLLLGFLCLFKRDSRRREPYRGSLSIILAARNEEAGLPRSAGSESRR